MLFSHSLHTVVQINNNLSVAISVALNNEKIINMNMHVHRKMYFSVHKMISTGLCVELLSPTNITAL